MSTDSGIFDSECVNADVEQGYYDFKLLITSANAQLYKATRQGKLFLIKTTKDNSEYQLRLLRREYELSIGCAHPNIIHVFTYETQLPIGEGIVMEYIDGRTLSEYIAEKPSRGERERVFRELLLAVQYLHKQTIIHNDIKPDNILISRADNSLKLIDFGLADSDVEMAIKHVGCTPRYASPELRSRSGVINARSDIYSLGVVMCELLGNSLIVRRATAYSADRRYSNVGSMLKAFENRYRWLKIFMVLVIIAAIGLYITYTNKRVAQGYKDRYDVLVDKMERDVAVQCATIRDSAQLALNEYIAMEQANKRQRDSLVAAMESEFENIYSACRDEVYHLPYCEFVYRSVSSMWNQLDGVYRRYVEQSESVDLNSLLSTRYDRLLETYVVELNGYAATLPSVYMDDNIEADKRHFLDSLLVNDLPYQPYQGDVEKTRKDNH